MRFKVLSMFAAVLLLAACETASDQSAGTAGTGGAAGAGAAQTRSMSAQERLVSQVGDRVFYDFDKSDLKPEARRTIERWAAFLKESGNANLSVTVEGHCDERGTREYNIGLGERRAAAAKNFLVSLGIDARRVQTVSFGKERPAVLGSNEAAWSQNRRGVMVVQ
jgi:peptidoglycan-associated lipoprotein